MNYEGGRFKRFCADCIKAKRRFIQRRHSTKKDAASHRLALTANDDLEDEICSFSSTTTDEVASANDEPEDEIRSFSPTDEVASANDHDAIRDFSPTAEVVDGIEDFDSSPGSSTPAGHVSARELRTCVQRACTR